MGQTDVWAEFQEKRGEMGYDPAVAVALAQERLGAKVAAAGGDEGLRGCVGTPDQVRQYLRRYEDAGVDQLIFIMQAGRNRHEDIMESMELFSREVMPEFKDRDEKLRAEKAARLEPAIEAAMSRRVDDRAPLPDGYVMDALPKQIVQQMGGDLDAMAKKMAVGEDLKDLISDEVGDEF